MTASALYRGRVMHRRLRPKAHMLTYRVFWLLLDLAEIDDLDQRLRLFSRNRFNLLSFHDRDHGEASGTDLRPRIEAWLARAGQPGLDLRPQRGAGAVAVVAIMKRQQVEAIAREQPHAPVQSIDLGQVQQQPEDAVGQHVRPGPHTPVHDLAAIKG